MNKLQKLTAKLLVLAMMFSAVGVINVNADTITDTTSPYSVSTNQVVYTSVEAYLSYTATTTELQIGLIELGVHDVMTGSTANHTIKTNIQAGYTMNIKADDATNAHLKHTGALADVVSAMDDDPIGAAGEAESTWAVPAGAAEYAVRVKTGYTIANYDTSVLTMAQRYGTTDARGATVLYGGAAITDRVLYATDGVHGGAGDVVALEYAVKTNNDANLGPGRYEETMVYTISGN